MSVPDGAYWVRNLCHELFVGQNAAFILGFRHAAEHLGDALKALYLDKAKRKERLNSRMSKLKTGSVSSIIGDLAPHREGGEAAAKCIDYFEKNMERMHCDSNRERGMRNGSGVVECSCRHIVGPRLKLSGSRRSVERANAMLSIKCCIANMRWVDFMDRKVKMPLAA